MYSNHAAHRVVWWQFTPKSEDAVRKSVQFLDAVGKPWHWGKNDRFTDEGGCVVMEMSDLLWKPQASAYQMIMNNRIIRICMTNQM